MEKFQSPKSPSKFYQSPKDDGKLTAGKSYQSPRQKSNAGSSEKKHRVLL
jgi:hypothetical protein